ncbi:NCS cytosine-purine permease [Phlegmacium glaucopus]|nr:NCS cytosine-purine permease [Phlegmacium glaucopus]
MGVKEVASIYPNRLGWRQVSKKLSTLGIESRGILPVPVDERIDKPYIKNFFMWFSMNSNILSFSSGTLGPVVFGLGLRNSCLMILFANLFCCAFPSYIATWGPKLGMRQMIISRYSFGYYGVMLICILDLLGLVGFAILNCILAGQAMASVANGNLSWSVGIVVIAMISLLVSFCGFTVLDWYERISWIPVLITFLIVSIVGGKHLSNSPPAVPATLSTILGFASTLAGFSIGYSSLSCDFTSYYRPSVSSWKIFLSTYAGLLLPIVPLQCLGAAVAVAVPSVPVWEQGYAGGNVGGLLEAVLQPVGNFGKFLMVLLSLSVASNNAAAFYSISINLQAFIPILVAVPRYVFSVVATAIIVPISIVGAHRFYDTITNFLGIIGYWSTVYLTILMTEHLHFRKNDASLYDVTAWNVPQRLPTGIAAVAAGVLSFAMLIPFMSQIWFTGPIARTTGDIGFEVAFVVSTLLYFLFRWIEIRWRGFI